MAERLQKILSAAGIASRRTAETLIAQGRVTVNGRTVTELGTRASLEDDDIRVDGRRVKGPRRRRYLLLYKPRGCDYCTGTGFRGRIGIFEMMQMNGEIRTLAFERAATNKIRKAALASGMKSLLADGRIKVINGITTAEEVVKVAQVEGIVTG